MFDAAITIVGFSALFLCGAIPLVWSIIAVVRGEKEGCALCDAEAKSYWLDDGVRVHLGGPGQVIICTNSRLDR